MAAAAPSAATALKRTKEGELVRRGQQYSLAIRRFYKRFGRYPSNVEQLENTNNIRFLRRRYLDPLTGKDDWTPIQFGQARPAVGFFGQKVTNTAGLSPSGPGIGPSSIGTGLSGAGASTSANSPSAGSTAGPGTNTGIGLSSSPGGPSGSASNPISSDQLSGRTFGGGAIVGFSVPSEKESLKEFQQKNHYNEWQFVYDPTLDPNLRGPGGVPGANNGIPGAQGIGPNRGPGGPIGPSPMTGPQPRR
jgi:hypothetical protein